MAIRMRTYAYVCETEVTEWAVYHPKRRLGCSAACLASLALDLA